VTLQSEFAERRKIYTEYVPFREGFGIRWNTYVFHTRRRQALSGIHDYGSSTIPAWTEGCAYTIHRIHHIHQYSSTSLHGPECCTNTSAFCCITVQSYTPRGGMIGTCMRWYTSTFGRFHSVSGSRGDHESLKLPFGGSQFSCW
jgi:hypothetical protein